MNETVRAVVFDLDGTLIESMPLVLQAYAHALRPHIPAITESEIAPRLGGPPARFFAETLANAAQAEEALRRFQEFGAAHWQTIQPFPGMNDLLAKVRAAGCTVAIWTGRDRESTEWLLRRHDIGRHVQAVVCGDDLPSNKPDPAGLTEALRRLGAEAGEALFVGDAAVDVLAGAAINVRTILIHPGGPLAAEVRAKAWLVTGAAAAAYAAVLRLLPPAQD